MIQNFFEKVIFLSQKRICQKKVSKHQFLKKHKKNLFHPAKQEYPEITKKNMLSQKRICQKKVSKHQFLKKHKKNLFHPAKQEYPENRGTSETFFPLHFAKSKISTNLLKKIKFLTYGGVFNFVFQP